MKKPRGYDETQIFTENKTLPPGGYICRIKQVKEITSRSGKEMIAILLDIAEGEYKDFYDAKFKSDTRTEKKWGCVVYQLVLDSEGNANRGFKTFNTSVEESNEGFKTVWGDDYANAFKNKLIGGLFRREQFETQDGKRVFSTKCFSFRSVDTIKKGDFKIPEDKMLEDDNHSAAAKTTQHYTVENNIDEDDLPF